MPDGQSLLSLIANHIPIAQNAADWRPRQRCSAVANPAAVPAIASRREDAHYPANRHPDMHAPPVAAAVGRGDSSALMSAHSLSVGSREDRSLPRSSRGRCPCVHVASVLSINGWVNPHPARKPDHPRNVVSTRHNAARLTRLPICWGKSAILICPSFIPTGHIPSIERLAVSGPF